MTQIEVFHSRNRNDIEEILKHGLTSKKRMILDRLLEGEPVKHEFEEWKQGLLYFYLDEPPKEYSWVSILVEPSSTLVANELLAPSYDSYRASIMSLNQFLKRQGMNEEFKPEEYRHPITARKIREAKIMKFTHTRPMIKGKKN